MFHLERFRDTPYLKSPVATKYVDTDSGEVAKDGRRRSGKEMYRGDWMHRPIGGTKSPSSCGCWCRSRRFSTKSFVSMVQRRMRIVASPRRTFTRRRRRWRKRGRRKRTGGVRVRHSGRTRGSDARNVSTERNHDQFTSVSRVPNARALVCASIVDAVSDRCPLGVGATVRREALQTTTYIDDETYTFRQLTRHHYDCESAFGSRPRFQKRSRVNGDGFLHSGPRGGASTSPLSLSKIDERARGTPR